MFTRHLVFMFAGGLLAPLTHAAATVTVPARLYNTAQVPAEARTAALAVATRAMRAGGVGVSWQNCDAPNACTLVPAPGELIIRLVRSRNAGSYVLGEASIDTAAGAGVLATIYVDRVERMAAASETDAVLLLGRAIAHEVGHLLMATNTHSASGLMRAKWTTAELRRDQPSDWILGQEEAAAISRLRPAPPLRARR